ncbi:putative transposase [Bradyrhizobium elkanii USDA 61]|nr:putative transposase [Bradyrhizobium elkanii]MCS3724874.1 putative transposase [Bradyrhizobium elkanii]MCS4012432.1 putative transposase [Bradyrhizobium elkanii USDA 61]
MRKMDIAALGPRPNTTRPAGPQDLSLSVAQLDDRPVKPGIGGRHHVSAIGRGFLYLVAIIDWASRAVLAWRLSNTVDVSFCVAALEEAPAKYGTQKILNTDQGSQFTSAAFSGALAGAGIKISMDGRGRWMDNVFIERLWRSLKHEDIDLKCLCRRPRGQGRRRQLDRLLQRSPLHQVHGYRTPMAVWRERMQAAKAVDMVDNALTTCPSVDAPVDAGPTGASRFRARRLSLE